MNDISEIGEKLMVDHLADMSITPVTLRRIFVTLARLHYSDANNFGEKVPPAFKQFIWSKDPQKSRLRIDNEFIYDVKKVDLLPGIFVGCGDTLYAKKVVDNQRAPTSSRDGQSYVKIGSTTVTLAHITMTPDEALMLGDISSQFFMGIQTLMQEQAGFLTYEVASTSRVRMLKTSAEERDKQFAVDLNINIQFNAVWTIFRESHRIKTISVSQSIAELLN